MTLKKKTKLDRFGTLKQFLAENLKEVKTHRVKGVAGGYAATMAFVIFWDATDARTGRATMTVSQLARLLCTNRDTARRCIAVLQELNLISPRKDQEGRPMKSKWIVSHAQRDDDSR